MDYMKSVLFLPAALMTLWVQPALPASYQLEPAGAPPSELPPAFAAALQPQGHRVLASDKKTVCEVWFVTKVPSKPASKELSVSWTTVPHGAYIGVIRFPAEGKERRGIAIKPGVYTLRFSLLPLDGAHLGVEPGRDFLMLSPLAADKDPAAMPDYEELMNMSRKATGTPHPGGLSMWVPADFQPGLALLGEHDWVLSAKAGETGVSLIVVGVNVH